MRNELDAFISYARVDREFVERLKEGLVALGRTPWIDTDEIPPGAPWRSELGTAIEAAVAFVFIVSPESVRSQECRLELERAVELGKRLLPVVLRPADMPAALATIQWIDARPGAEAQAAAAISAAIDTDYEWARTHTQWLARALRWERDGSSSLLPRGDELKSAEAWLARQPEGHEPPPTELQTRFITAARQRERKVLRRVAATAVMALAVMTALAVAAMVLRGIAADQRDRAQSRALAASAMANLDVDPLASLALAVRAADVDQTPEAVAALRGSLLASRQRAVLRGHKAAVTRTVLTDDGKLSASGDRGGGVRLWRVDRGRPLRALAGLSASVERLAFRSGGKELAGIDDAGNVRVWRVADGTVLASFKTGEVFEARTDARGRTLVTTGAGGTRVWRLPGGALVRSLGPRVYSVALSPDGRRALTGDEHGAVRLWDLRRGAGTLLAEHQQASRDVGFGEPLPAFGVQVGEVAFSPDGSLALSSGLDGTTNVYTAAGRRLSSIDKAAQAAFSPDGTWIAASDANGVLSVWRARSGRRELALEGYGVPAWQIGFSPNGQHVATALLDGTTRVWDRATGAPRAVLRAPAVVTAVAFEPDNRHVITGDRGGAIRTWDATATTQIRDPLKSMLVGASFDASGRRVLTVSGARAVTLWDSRTGRPTRDPGTCRAAREASLCLALGVANAVDMTSLASAGTALPYSADLSPSAQRVAIGTRGGQLEFWDVPSGQRAAPVQTLDERVEYVRFSPDGKRVAASAGKRARLFDAATAEEGPVLEHPGDVTGLSFTDGGATVVTAGDDGLVRLWRARDGTPAGSRRVSREGLLGVSGSVRGVIAAVDGDSALVWDSRGGHPPRKLRGQLGQVSSVAISPDGEFVAAGGAAATIRVWERRSGRHVATFGGHGNQVVSLAFSADGHHVLSASADGFARVFDCDACDASEDLKRLAEARVRAQLTPRERVAIVSTVTG